MPGSLRAYASSASTLLRVRWRCRAFRPTSRDTDCPVARTSARVMGEYQRGRGTFACGAGSGSAVSKGAIEGQRWTRLRRGSASGRADSPRGHGHGPTAETQPGPGQCEPGGALQLSAVQRRPRREAGLALGHRSDLRRGAGCGRGVRRGLGPGRENRRSIREPDAHPQAQAVHVGLLQPVPTPGQCVPLGARGGRRGAGAAHRHLQRQGCASALRAAASLRPHGGHSRRSTPRRWTPRRCCTDSRPTGGRGRRTKRSSATGTATTACSTVCVWDRGPPNTRWTSMRRGCSRFRGREPAATTTACRSAWAHHGRT